jgi:hypothetical protein
MPEENIEETETPEPSTAKKATVTVIAVVVTLACGLIAGTVSDKINKQIRDRIIPPTS